MEEPNWAIVLQALHEGELATGQTKGTGPTHTKYELYQFSVSETELSESEIENALEYLDDCGLITKYTVYSDEDDRVSRTTAGARLSYSDPARRRCRRLPLARRPGRCGSPAGAKDHLCRQRRPVVRARRRRRPESRRSVETRPRRRPRDRAEDR